MKFAYLLCPLVAWFVAGTLKFMINSFKLKRMAFDNIGYGGLPSTHSAIVTSMSTLIALQEGLNSPLFGVVFTLMIIVVIDAIGLRRQIGRHASEINQLSQNNHLKETMGHQVHEVVAGMGVGILVALLVK